MAANTLPPARSSATRAASAAAITSNTGEDIGGEERWACLGPKAGRRGCDKGGDAIQYLRERDHLTYPEACARLGIDAQRRRS